MESQDGRFWLAIGSRIYPFSYFPGSKINAWSYYDLGFTIEAFADISERIYARVGNTIYLFGGEDDETYPDAGEYPVTVEIPYLSANTPATRKSWHGIDRSEEHTSELQSLMRISYAVFCLNKKKNKKQ